MRRAPLAVLFILSATSAWSQFAPLELSAAQQDPKKYTLDEKTIKIERLGPTVNPTRAVPRLGEGDGSVNPLPVLNEIINTGERLWKIVVDNKPVVDVKTQYATGLPKGVANWGQMEGWLPPRGTIYELTAKNLYGGDMVRVRYQVLRTFGGSYEGKGKYLTAVTVEPLLVDVAWGYRFSMDASVPDSSLVNVGSSSQPVAGMTAEFSWRISTALKDAQGRSQFFLQGDGAFLELNPPLGAALQKARQAVDTPRREALP